MSRFVVRFMKDVLGGRQDAAVYVAWLAVLQSKIEAAVAARG